MHVFSSIEHAGIIDSPWALTNEGHASRRAQRIMQACLRKKCSAADLRQTIIWQSSVSPKKFHGMHRCPALEADLEELAS